MKLIVDKLSKKFKLHLQNSREISAVTDVSFSLKKGEFLSIIGPSGSGKSTILKCIYRTYLPTDGEIKFFKEDSQILNLHNATEDEVIKLRRGEIGYISQFLKVLPRVATLDIVAKPLIDIGVKESEAKEEARELLLYLGIKRELHDISPLTFSGGEQQRVNIAKEIIAPKKLLLVDEPTASLDEERKKLVVQLFKKLKEQNITIISIFHELDLINKITDKFLKLDEEKYAD